MSDVLQIGVSRPALPLADLPTPEEVFGVARFDAWTVVKHVLGPSMIALGAAIGSGEWLLGPLGFGRFGFMGLGFVVTVSAVLQTFYNVENARYTMATGEVPIVGFARMPPGMKFWVPLTLLLIYLAWLWGGWAAAAGQSIFAMFAGRTFDRAVPGELLSVRIIAIGLLFLSLGVYLFGRKISRTMEVVESFAVFFILAVLITLAIVFAPAALWGTMLTSIVTPAALPHGIDATTLGAIVGFTGFASGMNFMGKQVPWLFPYILILGALILWKTQTTLLEVLVRNTTDTAIAVSPRLRAWIGDDPRRFYYLVAVSMVIVISILIFQALPTQLLQYSANMANLAAIIYPIVLIYLNRRLPRPARAPLWSIVVLIANVLFFGFFFVNFLAVQITGAPLVTF